MYTYKTVCIFIWLLLVYGFSQAQNTYVFSGTVTDSTGKALPYVQVRIGETQATLTDTRGYFSLKHSQNKATLHFSLLGYEPLSINLKADTDPARIILREKPGQLEPVAIQAEKVPKLAESIWDYEFLDEYALLLQYKPRSARSRLLLADNQNLKQLSAIDVPAKTTGLFRDCLGHIHLLGEDSVSRILVDRGKIILQKSLPVSYFETYIATCVAQNRDFLYVQEREVPQALETESFRIRRANLSLHYYQVDWLTNTHKNLLSIVDSVGWHERYDQLLYNQRVLQTSSGANLPPGVLMGEFDQFFTETILLRDIYAPLFVVEDSVYVFDVLHAQLLTYNRLREKLHAVPIRFQKEQPWMRNIQQDPKTERVYTLFHTSQGFELREINLQSGNTGRYYAIPYPYIKNIKVRGGYVYFLYRSDQDSLVNYLSRIRLG